jgi:hypothetical protein
MSSWLKAGLIGGAALAFLSLLLTISGQILGLGCGITLLALLVFAGIGALAAYWMPPIREAGPAAGQGAIAAVLAQLIGGIAFTIFGVIQTSLADTAALVSEIDPVFLDQLAEMGMDTQILETMLGPTGAVLNGSLCCLGGLILAAILGAVGGALFAGIKAD